MIPGQRYSINNHVYWHPYMGAGFHVHFYYMLPIVGAFYVESFCVLGNYERVV